MTKHEREVIEGTQQPWETHRVWVAEDNLLYEKLDRLAQEQFIRSLGEQLPTTIKETP